MDVASMSTNFRARIWRADAVFAAVRRFPYGTRTFERGEVFPWKEFGMHINQVKALWLSVLIDCVEPTAVVASTPSRKQKRAAQAES